MVTTKIIGTFSNLRTWSPPSLCPLFSVPAITRRHSLSCPTPPSTTHQAQQREKEALLPCRFGTRPHDAPRGALKFLFLRPCSLLGPKPKSRKHMLGQRARTKIHHSNLEEAGGSSQIAANALVFEQPVAWVQQKHNQSLNIPSLASAHCSAHAQQSLRSAMSGDTTVAKRFEMLKFPVFIV